jgi:hypothetical protein
MDIKENLRNNLILHLHCIMNWIMFFVVLFAKFDTNVDWFTNCGKTPFVIVWNAIVIEISGKLGDKWVRLDKHRSITQFTTSDWALQIWNQTLSNS